MFGLRMILFVCFLSIFTLGQGRLLSNGVLRPSLMTGSGQFIAGGTDANPGMFPWQLSVQRRTVDWSHSFGGSLLSADCALIAAHIVDGSTPSNLRVVAGLHQQSDLTGTQIVYIASYIMHEGYGVGGWTYPNDIAILIFATPVTFGANIQPATLPADNTNSYAGYTCAITGWGSTGTSYPDTLQMADMQVINNDECSSVTDSRAADSQICVYDPDQIAGVCGGDGGGPLNCPDGVTRVVGVGSWMLSDGGDSCQQFLPAVFTRVSYYLDWIAANTP